MQALKKQITAATFIFASAVMNGANAQSEELPEVQDSTLAKLSSCEELNIAAIEHVYLMSTERDKILKAEKVLLELQAELAIYKELMDTNPGQKTDKNYEQINQMYLDGGELVAVLRNDYNARADDTAAKYPERIIVDPPPEADGLASLQTTDYMCE